MARYIMTRNLPQRQIVRGGQLQVEDSEFDVVRIMADRRIFVRAIVGRTAKNKELVSEVTKLRNGHTMVVARRDLLASVEGLTENGMTCTHLRYIREAGPLPSSERSVPKIHNNIRPFQLLLAALLYAGRKPESAPGGCQYMLAYRHGENDRNGQMIVPAPTKAEKAEIEKVEEECRNICALFDHGEECEDCEKKINTEYRKVKRAFVVDVQDINGLIEALPPEDDIDEEGEDDSDDQNGVGDDAPHHVLHPQISF